MGLEFATVPIFHPAYRAFEKWRVETNDAGVAILLGLRLGDEHLSAMPPILRRELLPELVDSEDARRLNLPGDEVIQKLREAESIYAAMAIPFHVAVFNEFLVKALELLQRDGQALGADAPHKLMLGSLRKALTDVGVALSPDYEAVMNFAQKLRNSIVHDGAVVRVGILDVWAKLSDAQANIWATAAGRTPTMTSGERLPLGPGEVRAALATTTVLARNLNDELGRLISRSTWAEIVVEDWRSEAPDKWADWERRARNAGGWARHFYGPLALTDSEIQAAVAARS